MEDLAQVYARALFQVASERDAIDTVREQLGEFADAVEGDRNLSTFFFSPYFSTEKKKDGLHGPVEGADESVMNFLELLLARRRRPLPHGHRRRFDARWRQQ